MDVRELLTVKLCWVCRSSCLVLLCALPTVSPPCRGRPAWIRHWFLPMLYSCFWTNHRAVQAKTAIVVSAQTPEQPIGEKRHLKVDMDLKTHAYKHKNKYTVIWNIIIQIKYSLIHRQSGETNLFLYQIEEFIMSEDVLSIRSQMNQIKMVVTAWFELIFIHRHFIHEYTYKWNLRIMLIWCHFY